MNCCKYKNVEYKPSKDIATARLLGTFRIYLKSVKLVIIRYLGKYIINYKISKYQFFPFCFFPTADFPTASDHYITLHILILCFVLLKCIS